MTTPATTIHAQYSIQTHGLNLWYADFQALRGHHGQHQTADHHSPDRTVRLRQDDTAKML